MYSHVLIFRGHVPVLTYHDLTQGRVGTWQPSQNQTTFTFSTFHCLSIVSGISGVGKLRWLYRLMLQVQYYSVLLALRLANPISYLYLGKLRHRLIHVQQVLVHV